MPKLLRSLSRVSAIVIFAGLSGPVHADSISGIFTLRDGPGPLPGATATLTLNADGTVSGTVTSLTSLSLVGFGVDSIGQFDSYDFSDPDTISSGWGTSFGGFSSGWSQTTTGVTTMTWIIGPPGTFSSVLELLAGGNSPYDAFVFAHDDLSGDYTQYAANFNTAPVPEPETSALLLAGLGAVAATARRRRPAAH